MVAMWRAMMIAMMLPSAAPAILLYAAVDRRQSEKGAGAPLPVAIFASGYALGWAGSSVIAAAPQWAFEWAGILSPRMMSTTSLGFAGGVLALWGAAFLYEGLA